MCNVSVNGAQRQLQIAWCSQPSQPSRPAVMVAWNGGSLSLQVEAHTALEGTAGLIAAEGNCKHHDAKACVSDLCRRLQLTHEQASADIEQCRCQTHTSTGAHLCVPATPRPQPRIFIIDSRRCLRVIDDNRLVLYARRPAHRGELVCNIRGVCMKSTGVGATVPILTGGASEAGAKRDSVTMGVAGALSRPAIRVAIKTASLRATPACPKLVVLGRTSFSTPSVTTVHRQSARRSAQCHCRRPGGPQGRHQRKLPSRSWRICLNAKPEFGLITGLKGMPGRSEVLQALGANAKSPDEVLQCSVW